MIKMAAQPRTRWMTIRYLLIFCHMTHVSSCADDRNQVGASLLPAGLELLVIVGGFTHPLRNVPSCHADPPFGGIRPLCRGFLANWFAHCVNGYSAVAMLSKPVLNRHSGRVSQRTRAAGFRLLHNRAGRF